MLEICLNGEIKDKLIKIKRKVFLEDFRSFLIQELAFTFVFITLIRMRTLQLSGRSHISNQKKMIFNCGKV